eukprot:gene12857-15099_t
MFSSFVSYLQSNSKEPYDDGYPKTPQQKEKKRRSEQGVDDWVSPKDDDGVPVYMDSLSEQYEKIARVHWKPTSPVKSNGIVTVELAALQQDDDEMTLDDLIVTPGTRETNKANGEDSVIIERLATQRAILEKKMMDKITERDEVMRQYARQITDMSGKIETIDKELERLCPASRVIGESPITASEQPKTSSSSINGTDEFSPDKKIRSGTTARKKPSSKKIDADHIRLLEKKNRLGSGDQEMSEDTHSVPMTAESASPVVSEDRMELEKTYISQAERDLMVERLEHHLRLTTPAGSSRLLTLTADSTILEARAYSASNTKEQYWETLTNVFNKLVKPTTIVPSPTPSPIRPANTMFSSISVLPVDTNPQFLWLINFIEETDEQLVNLLKKDYLEQKWITWRSNIRANTPFHIAEENLFRSYYLLGAKTKTINHLVTLALCLIVGRPIDNIPREWRVFYKERPFEITQDDTKEDQESILAYLKEEKKSIDITPLNLIELRRELNKMLIDNLNSLAEESLSTLMNVDAQSKGARKKNKKSDQPIKKKGHLWIDHDVARGNLPFPLRAVNEYDTVPIMFENFAWIDKSFRGDSCNSSNEDSVTEFEIGDCCQCIGDCYSPENLKTCKCMIEAQHQPYYNEKKQLIRGLNNGQIFIHECRKSCSCSVSDICSNRVVQRGQKYPFELFKTKSKGWGVRSITNIPQDTFVCEYVGEIITNAEAEIRGKKYDKSKLSYLFDLDCDPATDVEFVIDATNYGNEARFLNHSCDSNLEIVLVFDSYDHRMPRIAFFSRRPIREQEELTFDYGYQNPIDNVPSKKKGSKTTEIQCRCGAAQCRKILWKGRK